MKNSGMTRPEVEARDPKVKDFPAISLGNSALGLRPVFALARAGIDNASTAAKARPIRRTTSSLLVCRQRLGTLADRPNRTYHICRRELHTPVRATPARTAKDDRCPQGKLIILEPRTSG